MNALALLLMLQASGWEATPRTVTVGDTVTLTRRLAAEPDVRVRMELLSRTPIVEPLQSPQWSYAEGDVTLVYKVAFFESGSQRLIMPPVELAHADGRVEALEGETALVEVRSVLPAADTLPLPMPLRAPIARERTSPLPLLGTMVGALGMLAFWAVLRQRRRLLVAAEPVAVAPAPPPLDLWVAAGESRAVAAAVAQRLRDLLARYLPDAGAHLDTEACVRVVLASGLGEIGQQIVSTLRALERARFSPAAPGDVLDVADQADALIAMLGDVEEKA